MFPSLSVITELTHSPNDYKLEGTQMTIHFALFTLIFLLFDDIVHFKQHISLIHLYIIIFH